MELTVLNRVRREKSWRLLGAGIIGGALATILTLAVTSAGDSSVNVGTTFTLKVKSYYGPEGPQPNVICFERELNCGFPVLADPGMVVEAGEEVTVTEIFLDGDNGEQRLVFVIHAQATR